MTAQVWMVVSIVGFALAVIVAGIALIVFFRLKIWGVIGILTGKTRGKEIDKIWNESMRSIPVTGTGKFEFFDRQENATGKFTDSHTFDPEATDRISTTTTHRQSDETELLVCAQNETELLVSVPAQQSSEGFKIIQDKIVVHAE